MARVWPPVMALCWVFGGPTLTLPAGRDAALADFAFHVHVLAGADDGVLDELGAQRAAADHAGGARGGRGVLQGLGQADDAALDRHAAAGLDQRRLHGAVDHHVARHMDFHGGGDVAAHQQ
jgi:hypothetical protein